MSHKILVVDDDPDAREELRLYLRGAGHEVLEACDGEEALRAVATRGPDLILMEVILPRMDGFETTRRIKQQHSDEFLPIITVTGLRDQSSRLLSFRVGADDFLSHPVDRIELGVRVANLLALRDRHLALARRNEELVELQRFRDEMSSTVVHDLKNPLAVVMANLAYAIETLHEEPGVDLDVRQALVESQQAGQRILRLLANLVDTARIEAKRLTIASQAVAIGELLKQIGQQRRVIASSRDIHLEVRIPTDIEAIVDVDLLTRAMENVVDNALRYTPTGGTIALWLEPSEDEVDIMVGNDGPPIPAETRHSIFEKYGHTGRHSGRMNLGLGLYFCRLATEAHGGTLELSATGEFPTVFRFRLPLGRAARTRHAERAEEKR